MVTELFNGLYDLITLIWSEFKKITVPGTDLTLDVFILAPFVIGIVATVVHKLLDSATSGSARGSRDIVKHYSTKPD